jgi:Na+/H+-translocating membrane pyrophosphatase
MFVAEREAGEFYTTTAFMLGALTSCVSGYIGMKVAVFSNFRTTYKA